MSGNVAVGNKFLSFLPHLVIGPRGPAAVDATSMNPGFLTATGVTRNDPLQKILERRVLEDGVPNPKHAEFRTLRFGLVDLTGESKLRNPQYAGHRDLEQGGIGSLAKIACMWAAFQLKFDLEDLARSKGLTTDTALFKAARDIWDATQQPDPANITTLHPSKPKIELSGKLVEIDGKASALPRGVSAPDLERMFTVTPDGTGGVNVRFIGNDKIFVDPSAFPPGTPQPPHISPDVRAFLATSKENLEKVRALTFAERLFLMIDESDNAACHSVMENVSMLYIASALWQANIYSPERGGGLWEASTHLPKGIRWILPPVPGAVKGSDFVSATAASVSALLTLMAQNRLVNITACQGMKQLLNKQKRFRGGSLTRSFFLEGVDAAALPFDDFFSKLGIGNFLNDGVIVTRTVGDPQVDPTKPVQIRYVATGFDCPMSSAGPLQRLIVELDKCILENNGFITASTP